MILLYVRNSQHVTLFHPEGGFLDCSAETGKFLFGTIQKKPKPAIALNFRTNLPG